MKAKMERKRNIYKLKYLLIKKPKKLDNVWFFSLLNSLWASANESNMESNILCLPCIRCEYTVKRPKSTLTHTIKDNTVRMQMFEMIRWCKQLPYLLLFHTFNEKKCIKRFCVDALIVVFFLSLGTGLQLQFVCTTNMFSFFTLHSTQYPWNVHNLFLC